MYTTLTIVFLVIVFSIYIPSLKKFRKKNKELIELFQTLIITTIGIFIGMQLSIWDVETDEKERLIQQINTVQDESKQILSVMNEVIVQLARIPADSSQNFQEYLQKNRFPNSYLLPVLIENPSGAKYCSSRFLGSLSQVQRNFEDLQFYSRSDMNFLNAHTIVYGYTHQIESLIQYLDIEKEFLSGKIDANEVKQRYYVTMVMEGEKITKYKRKSINDYAQHWP